MSLKTLGTSGLDCYKTDASSMFELVLPSDFTYQLFHHGLKCAAPNLDKIDLHITTISTFLNAVSVLPVCSRKILCCVIVRLVHLIYCNFS